MSEASVLLVPGYLGTRLRHRPSGRLVWGTLRSLFRTTPDELAGDCEIAGPVDAITVIPRVWTYTIYGRFRRAFSARLTVFEYDWRRSHADTGRELAHFLGRFDRPVHAVAHSTGGYVLDWCLRYGGAQPRQFASITWVGVPWEGTVAAAHDMTVGWRAAPFGRRFPPDMVRRFPSVHEALPAWTGAWRRGDGSAVDRDPFDGCAEARAVREALAKPPHWPPVPQHLLVGERIRTRDAVCVTEKGFAFDRFWGPGDGTVPLQSALPPARPIPAQVTVHRVHGRHRYLLSRPDVIRLIRSWC